MTTPAQSRAIHALRRRSGMTDADYRAYLGARFCVPSSTALNGAQAVRLIDELKGLVGQSPGGASSSRRKASATASGKYAPVLQALWISAWNLGLVRSADDAAMLAFVARQTGVAHSRFLVNASDATRAIEGLKAWIAREAPLQWPQAADASAVSPLSWLRKVVVVQAIAKAIVAAGTPCSVILHTLNERQLDELANRLGVMLRAIKAELK